MSLCHCSKEVGARCPLEAVPPEHEGPEQEAEGEGALRLSDEMISFLRISQRKRLERGEATRGVARH